MAPQEVTSSIEVNGALQASRASSPLAAAFIENNVAYHIMAENLFELCHAQACFTNELGAYNYVALRLDKRSYILSPSGDPRSVPFETALKELNPEAVCTITSEAIRAILKSTSEDKSQIPLTPTEHIQIVDTIEELAWARQAQKACFIRREQMMVVWSIEAEDLISTVQYFHQKAILYVWQHRQLTRSSSPASNRSDLDDHPNRSFPLCRTPNSLGSAARELNTSPSPNSASRPVSPASANFSIPTPLSRRRFFSPLAMFQPSKDLDPLKEDNTVQTEKFKEKPEEIVKPELAYGSVPERPVIYFQAAYAGIAMALCLVLCANFARTVLLETLLDGVYIRMAMLACLPFLFLIILFVCDSIVGPLAMIFMPIRQMSQNSLYYSGKAPLPLPSEYPHISIVIPVYKEGLVEVLAPTIASVSKAVQTYELQGGTASIIVCEDGLQLVDEAERTARIEFYDRYSCAWVARHPQNRAGRFKKSSNLNVMKRLSLRVEAIMAERRPDNNLMKWTQMEEDELYARAMKDALAEHDGKTWASGNFRIGDYILLLDSDTRIPNDCLLDAASEMEGSPEVAILQHCSGTFVVGAGFFEKGIAFFTHVVNFSISWIVASGCVAPFMGHNAFLRWSALQHQADISEDGTVTVWSEEHVSEDFVMAMKLQRCGYIIRWATYSNLGYLEGVSLSCGDELNRWQKYAFGCSEIIFNPIHQWFKKGPMASVWMSYLWCPTPISAKHGTTSYVTSYWAIAAAVPLTFGVFIVQCVRPDTLDRAFLTSRIGTPFSIFVGVLFIFVAGGTIGRIAAQYRSQDRGILAATKEQLIWLPFFVCFFSGLSWHVATALGAHITGYNMTWTATVKDKTISNMFIELRLIFKQYWKTLLMMVIAISATITVAAPILPLPLRIYGVQAIFPILWVSSMHIAYPLLLNPWVLLFHF